MATLGGGLGVTHVKQKQPTTQRAQPKRTPRPATRRALQTTARAGTCMQCDQPSVTRTITLLQGTKVVAEQREPMSVCWLHLQAWRAYRARLKKAGATAKAAAS